MRRWKSSLLALALAVGAFAQTGSSPLVNPNVRRVGEQLKCLCGCKATVTSCDMLQCHYADPRRHEIVKMVNAGFADDRIIETIGKEQGLQAILKPPTQGLFYTAGWFMPALALLLGFGVVYLFVTRLRRPAMAGGPSRSAADPLDRYRDRIEEELSRLD